MLTKTHVVHIWIFGYLNGPIMLIDLLGDGLSYEAEVFVDDKTTNINNMTDQVLWNEPDQKIKREPYSYTWEPCNNNLL